MASIEDLLLLKAAEDAAAVPTQAEAAAVGAALGAGSGALLGQPLHSAGSGINALFGVKPRMLAPGPRMAGGLVGLILGGGLGVAARESMIQDSPAARMLAKAQVQGDLNTADRQALERMLAEIYSEMGLR